MNNTLVGILLYAVLGVVTYGVYRIVLDRLTDEQIGHTDRGMFHALVVLGAVLWPVTWGVQTLSIVHYTIRLLFKSSES